MRCVRSMSLTRLNSKIFLFSTHSSHAQSLIAIPVTAHSQNISIRSLSQWKKRTNRRERQRKMVQTKFFHTHTHRLLALCDTVSYVFPSALIISMKLSSHSQHFQWNTLYNGVSSRTSQRLKKKNKSVTECASIIITVTKEWKISFFSLISLRCVIE